MRMAEDKAATFEEIGPTMERQTEHMVTLIDDLLDVSRITRGKLDLRKLHVQLANVVELAIETSRPLIDDQGHELTVNLPDEPIGLNADPHRLAQVLSNLLNNAAKYTPENGHIELTAQRQDGEVAVTVTDDGIGIPVDQLERIFEMFGQIDHPMKHTSPGLGIGLTLVKSLVELHDGRIEVHSDGAGQGSEFTVWLPISAEAPIKESPAQALEDEVVSSSKSSKCRVLVVDDNRDAASMLSQVITMSGHQVRTAGNGQEAIDIAAEFRPDLVLMDLGMPQMDGYDAARQMRGQDWGQSMTLIALSGWGKEQDKQKTKEAGFDQHLIKPPDPAELKRILAGVKSP